MNRIAAPLLLFSCLCSLFIQFPEFSNAEEGVSQPAASVRPQVTPESEVVRLYRQHRQEFADKKLQLEQQQSQATNTVQALEKQISELESKIEKKDKEVNDLNWKITQEQAKHIGWISARGGLACIAVFELGYLMVQGVATLVNSGFLGPLLGPLAAAGGVMSLGLGAMLACVVFPITIVILMIKVWRGRLLKDMAWLTKGGRIAIIASAIILVCAIASPLFAANMQTEEQVAQKLESVGKVLGQSDYQRWIEILKNLSQGQAVNVRPLRSGDPRFPVFSRVTSGSPGYWSTLAGLSSHENHPGEMLAAIDGLVQSLAQSGLGADGRLEMALHCLDYLLEKQETNRVTNAVEKFVTSIGDTGVLLKLAATLEKGGQQSSAQKALEQAVMRANSAETLFELARYFVHVNKGDKAGEALIKALSRCNTAEKFTELIAIAFDAKNDGVIKDGIEAFKKNSFPVDRQMRFIDFLLQHNRKEDAIAIFTNVVNSSLDRDEKVWLFLIDAALERGLIDEALSATWNLYKMVRGSGGDGGAAYVIPFAERRLHKATTLPDPKGVMLPEFYGLLYEEKELNDMAERTYIVSLLSSLERILNSHGYDLPQTPNGYYLIGEIWTKNNKIELLKRLDLVYQAIERQVLNRMERGDQDDVRWQPLQTKLQGLEQHFSTLQKLSMEKELELSRSARKTFFHVISTIASYIFFIAATVGCATIAWRYSRTLTSCRTFGFFFKFIEITSWLRVMSIIGVVSGILGVVLGQFNQIFQQNQEHNKRAADKLAPAPRQ